MGLFGNSEEETLKSTGEVNNNVFVSNPVNIESGKMVTLLGIICVVKVLEFLYICFKAYQRGQKKKYLQRT